MTPSQSCPADRNISMLNTQDSQTLARWPRRLGHHVASNCTLGSFSRRDQPVSIGRRVGKNIKAEDGALSTCNGRLPNYTPMWYLGDGKRFSVIVNLHAVPHSRDGSSWKKPA